MSTAEVVLEVRSGTKRFGAVTALDDVDLKLHKGEVLALLGDNGAGKSTMTKCLSGVYQLDEGEILINGKPVVMKGPPDARAAGIETVYQDLALFDNLSAAENFFAGREELAPTWLGPFGFVRKRDMRKVTSDALNRLQIGVKDPNAEVGLMSGGQRQAIAVARAEAFASNVVVLDEPTAALGLRESGKVIDLIKRLPEQGISVILISHNMEEVMAVADNAVVFRQGRRVGSAIPRPENHQKIVGMIMGAFGHDDS